MMSSLQRFRAALIATIVLSAVATACADTPDSQSDSQSEEAAEDQASAAVSDDARGVEVSEELDVKPEITLPGGEPPAELIIIDVVEGGGEVVEAGSTVTTEYVGASWTNDGAEFDSSWDRGEPATFPLSGVISGWTVGIPGMKVGGRRLLIIPPDQAYGAQPPSSGIAPDDTLVFVIDLTEVQ